MARDIKVNDVERLDAQDAAICELAEIIGGEE